MIQETVTVLKQEMPKVMRWAGAIAKTLRQYNISITGKTSGYATTDALTLADITLQELLVSALRDIGGPVLKCQIEAEEENGPLDCFSQSSNLVISLDPIDGTKQYRDHTGNGYAVMLHLRDTSHVYYSLVFLPEMGEFGTWVEVEKAKVTCIEDAPPTVSTSKTARELLDEAPALNAKHNARDIYIIGFQNEDEKVAEAVDSLGLNGIIPSKMPGSIYPLLANSNFAGSLIHTPNVYDYPVSKHIASEMGGSSKWAHNEEDVNFSETWMDDKAGMLRLPGIVATALQKETTTKLCRLAASWDQRRYKD